MSLRVALLLGVFLLALVGRAPAANPTNVQYQGTLNSACATSTGCQMATPVLAGSDLCATLTPPSAVIVQVSGTFTGTLTIEGTTDGVGYTTVSGFASTVTTPTLAAATVTTVTQLCVRMSAYTSGSALVTITVANQTAVATTGSGGGGTSLAPLQGGADAVTPGNNQSVALHGFNGTNLDAVRVANAGSTVAANSPGVLVVQGTAAAGVLPVNGTVTANAGTGNFTVTQGTGSNLHMVCDSGCGATPGWNYTNTTTTTVVVIKASPGLFAGIVNLSTAAQTTGMTCTWYDNASLASGTVLYTASQIGPGQVIPIGGSTGVKTVNGLTMQCTGGTPGGFGVQTLWQ